MQCLRTGHAARASLDAAARCNSAGRIFASRKTGARRAKRASETTRGNRRASCTLQHAATPLATREQDVGPWRAAGQRSVASNESGQLFAFSARVTGIAGCRGAARECGPHRRKTGAKRARSARCGAGRNKLRASRAGEHTVTVLGTGEKYVEPHRAAGQRSVCWQRTGTTVFANLARKHKHLWTSWRGARVLGAWSQTAIPERCASEARDVARRAAGLERRAPRDAAGDGQKAWGHGERPGNGVFAGRESGKRLIKLGARHGHRWTSPRGARVWPASSRSAQCGTMRGRLKAPHARRCPSTPGEKDAGPRRTAGKEAFAGRE